MSSSPSIPLLGRAGAYELLVEVASGGMATVYLARGPGEGGILVAVKRPHRHLASDPVFAAMFSDEARLASAIHHRNVVKVRELGFDSAPGPRGPVPEPFLVLDYVEGASLSDLRKELAAAKRAVDTRVAVRIIVDALAGLHAAHELRDEKGKLLGIIHRDVSPHNVLVGSDGVSRLTDFGIAKAEDNVQVTRTHEVKGKLAYLAPERVDKRRTCTVQSDVFSMAVVLWECIAGRRLFRGEEAIDTLEEVMSAPIPRLRQLGADIPAALDEALAKGLERDLAKRWKTARELGEAIQHAAGTRWIGRPEDVSHVVEAIFGARLRIRHQQIRGAVGEDAARALFARSGLPERPEPRAEPLTPDTAILSAIAPEAPSGRYAMGSLPAVKKERKWVVPLVVGAVSGLALGSLGLGYLARGQVEVHSIHPLASVHLAPVTPSTTDPPSTLPSASASSASAEEADQAPIELDDDAGVRPHAIRHKPRPIGTVRNGFTKLK